MSDIQQKLDQARELFMAGRVAEAKARLQRLAQQTPRDATVAIALATVLTACGEHEQAVFYARRALSAAPDDPDALITLANGLALLKRGDESLPLFEKAAALAPERAEPRLGLASLYRERTRLSEAIEQLRAGLRFHPEDQTLESLLGATLWSSARVEECVDVCRASLARAPGHLSLLSLLANAMNYVPSATAEETLAAHRAYGAALMASVPRTSGPWGNSRDPERPLRLGLLSCDLKQHSVAYFVVPLIEHLRGPGISLTCYSTAHTEDRVSAKLKAMGPAWVNASRLDDAALADHIRSDRIDILIETSGLTIGHRLGVPARRCAPVQVTYCGYPNTTGVPAIDWRIVDSITDPPGAEDGCVERLYRLEPCFLCYRPPDEAGPVAVRPPDAPVTFGSFNAAVKINDRILGLWSAVLLAVPGSTLILKSFDFRDAKLRADVSRRISERGIDPARIRVLEPTVTVDDHLRHYDQVDIALDTFPYHGTTTTLEALWMGVPVVTLAGTLHPGRVGVSLLTAMGLPDLIAADEAEYVKIAAGLAIDEAKRAELRRTLRSRMAASPLCDGSAFARRFEAAMRSMWREWCGAEDPGAPPLQ